MPHSNRTTRKYMPVGLCVSIELYRLAYVQRTLDGGLSYVLLDHYYHHHHHYQSTSIIQKEGYTICTLECIVRIYMPNNPAAAAATYLYMQDSNQYIGILQIYAKCHRHYTIIPIPRQFDMRRT